MSFKVHTAQVAHLPELKRLVSELPAKRRPCPYKTYAVASVLADRYQDKRGWANESVVQLAEATCLSERTVRSCLSALEDLGVWVRVGSGNRYAPAKRVPKFLESQPEPSPKPDLESQPEPSVKDAQEFLERQVTTPRATGNGSRATGQPVDTTDATTVSTPVLSSVVKDASKDDDRIGDHIKAHIEWKRTDPKPITNPVAFTEWAKREMADFIEEMRELGEDEWAALEAKWPTKPDVTAGEFDPGAWKPESGIERARRRRIEWSEDTERGAPCVVVVEAS